MRDSLIDQIGRTLRVVQMHKLNTLVSPKNYIRIAVAHYVKRKDEDNFEAILCYLKSNYNLLTPQEFFQAMIFQGTPMGRSILITFDDGLKSSYVAAKKILSKYNIKAAFFIPTKILELKDSQEMLTFAHRHLYYGDIPIEQLSPEEYLTMTKDEIVDLHREGHMILPHTHTHRKLIDMKDKEAIDDEIIKPKRILEDLLHEKIYGFAFPIGTERVVSSYVSPHIKKEYKFCFSALAGKNTGQTNPYFIHRDCVHAHYSLAHVQNMIDGVFDMYYQVKLFKLKRRFGTLPS